jgi:CTP:molybdopterin cytidylyltransferase MocA
VAAHGLLLAAGAGSRMGMPKALVRDDGSEGWLATSVAVLREGGCEDVTVVLGAAADEALPLLDGAGADVVVAHDWADGMSASLRAGIRALLAGSAAEAAVVLLVDLPDVTADVVRRVLAAGAGPAYLRRASYDGEPGHPVVIGREHWAALLETLEGDSGARAYLARRDVALVECGDLATGRDVDSPL